MKTSKLSGENYLLWASKFMMPEHAEAIDKAQQISKRKAKPSLDQQQWETFEDIICEAMGFHQALNITYYNNYDYELLVGYVIYLDFDNKVLNIHDQFEALYKVHFNDVIDVRFN